MTRPTLLLLGPLTLLPLTGHAQVLYDGSLGTTMIDQGWTGAALFIDNPFLFPPPLVDNFATLENGAYRLDTTSDFDLYAGHGLNLPSLDPDQGYALSFELEIVDEDHLDTNRAGYSVLVVSSDTSRSLEVAFWEDRVWVYDYVEGAGEDFVQGTGTAFDTTVCTTYTLAVLGSGYTLSADGGELFSGQLEDYTGREFPLGVPDPYETPNSIAISDNTSRGRSVTRLYRVELLEDEAPDLVLVDGFESP